MGDLPALRPVITLSTVSKQRKVPHHNQAFSLSFHPEKLDAPADIEYNTCIPTII